MIRFVLALSVSAVLAPAAFAEPEAKQLAGLVFDSADSNSDGFVTMEEYQTLAGDIFYSMDSDSDKSLTYEEFQNWGFGMENIAEDEGRLQAYDTARRVVFDLWDRSYDRNLSEQEQRRGTAMDFFQSDEDRDGRLSREEYLRHSIQNVTLRSALRPAD